MGSSACRPFADGCNLAAGRRRLSAAYHSLPPAGQADLARPWSNEVTRPNQKQRGTRMAFTYGICLFSLTHYYFHYCPPSRAF